MKQANFSLRMGALAVLPATLLSWESPARAEDAGTDRAARGAVERVEVAGVALVAEAEIWSEAALDAAAATGHPIPATVVLRVSAEGEPVPEGLRIDGVWYINGAAVSKAGAPIEQMSAPEGEVIGQTLEVVDSDGDGWVDVVVGVVDAGGKHYLIRAPNQQLRTF
jgi:hypothetical protein